MHSVMSATTSRVAAGHPPAEGSTRATLYAMLEVDPNASPAELKAGYERFVQRAKSAQGASTEEQLEIMQQAYVVLADPKKRALYDQYGDKVWDLLNNPYVDAMFQTTDHHSLIKWIIVAIIVTTIIIFLQTVMIAMKVDGTLKWSWGVMLIPIWVFCSLAGLTLLYLLFSAIQIWNYRNFEQEGMTPQQIRRARIEQVTVQVYYWSWVLFAIAVGWGLDRPARALWALYFALAIGGECVGLVISLPKCHPERIRAKMDAQSGIYTSEIVIGLMVVLSLISALWRIPFLVLVALNVSSINAGISYFLVCIPLYLAVIGFWEYAFTFAKQRTTTKAQAWLGIIPVTFVQVMFMLSVLLTCGKLQGAGRSLGDALVPCFILEVLAIAFAIGLLFAFKYYDREMRKAATVRSTVQQSGAQGVLEAARGAMGSMRKTPPPKVTLA